MSNRSMLYWDRNCCSISLGLSFAVHRQGGEHVCVNAPVHSKACVAMLMFPVCGHRNESVFDCIFLSTDACGCLVRAAWRFPVCCINGERLGSSVKRQEMQTGAVKRYCNMKAQFLTGAVEICLSFLVFFFCSGSELFSCFPSS